MTKSQPLLSMRLSVHYRRKTVLRDVAFDIAPGEILGLVGQSGSGKSSLALAVLGLLEMKNGQADGNIDFAGSDLLRLGEREMRRIRGRSLGLVLQSPLTSLNPALKIRTQLKEAWRAHATGTGSDCDVAIERALASVSLPYDKEFLRRYPSQLSVGQAQRVLIAMAVIHRPALLIADEATSALDVITQSEILALFARLNQESGMSILYISHDLPSVAGICHRVAILHEGEIVECESTERIFTKPQHAYTRRLVASLPGIPSLMPVIAKRAASGMV
ncbi:MAG TPA: ABC transporter ATP-binding protein [Terriglobales bacterium]|nr:ABC transporter ATP-binding protein [Terriglobales bacterium]